MGEDKEIKMTEEELEGLLTQLESENVNPIATNIDIISICDPLELDEEEFTQIVQTKEFIDGESIGARLLGIYTILINGGVPIKTCTDIIANQQTLDHNFNLQIEINKNNIEINESKIIKIKEKEL